MKFYINKTALFLSVALAGCTHSISNVDTAGKTNSPVFPEIQSAVRGDGTYISFEEIAKVKPGMTKHNIYELVGVPHFNEGVFGVKEWDYILHIGTASGNEITCQYKVLFDSRLRVGSTWFKPENCLTLANDAAAASSFSKEISAEALFAFADSQLSPQGVETIRQIAMELKQAGQELKTIKVTGHTDRIGSQEKNYQLSLARAQSVKNILVANGISPESIRTDGVGSTMPRVMCPGAKSPAVVACLSPNRRITIEVK
ncbi:OmpA family protein [Enterobacter ludwigii]|uniref:OmpA family protein n=1 Tax=Enterobacter ludwigii TaxID=299767 RepID=UPI003F6E5759